MCTHCALGSLPFVAVWFADSLVDATASTVVPWFVDASVIVAVFPRCFYWLVIVSA